MYIYVGMDMYRYIHTYVYIHIIVLCYNLTSFLRYLSLISKKLFIITLKYFSLKIYYMKNTISFFIKAH